MSFINNKRVCLSKVDKSKKGSVDDKILRLVTEVNENSHYYTTSSCSGRILLQTVPESGRKDDAEWIFVSHDLVNTQDLVDAIINLENSLVKQDVWFRMESAILHVCSDTLENAQKLVDFARNCGFKRTGIQSTSRKFIVEIVGSERIDTIIYSAFKTLVGYDYVHFLVKEANNKLKINWSKLEKLEHFF